MEAGLLNLNNPAQIIRIPENVHKSLHTDIFRLPLEYMRIGNEEKKWI